MLSIRRAPLLVLSAVLALSSAGNSDAQTRTAWLGHYREPAARLVAEATGNAFAWQRLAVLTDTFGHRLSGSPQLERAIQWAAEEMKRDGLENVHLEPVMVPKWVRGRERADIVQPAQHALVMLGLGDSVGTPAEGIEAEVLVVQSFAELDAKSALAKGRIVFFNVPFTNYGDSRLFRMSGPSRAARHGAVATLIRSIGPTGLRLPHTGVLQYGPDAPKIPAAAVAAEDADLLQRMASRGQRIVVRLQMEAHFEGEVESANVVGELRGRERPDEIVVVGGHLDSWDVGAGASDDGGGCIVTWEALRLMKKLGLRPRRTVRVVLFTNEENGGRGGLAYRDAHRSELSKHVMMLESDTGVFRPTGFGFSGTGQARETVKAIASLLTPIGATRIEAVGGGADIEPSVREHGIPSLSLEVEGDYFVIHHTPADTVDRIDPAHLAKCAAAVAVMAYVVADMPHRLGESPGSVP
jgi:carboxypeptidase Q